MRLGLIADIHERVEFLRAAFDRFRQEQVDRVVVLGDVFEAGERIEETCIFLGRNRRAWRGRQCACGERWAAREGRPVSLRGHLRPELE